MTANPLLWGRLAQNGLSRGLDRGLWPYMAPMGWGCLLGGLISWDVLWWAWVSWVHEKGLSVYVICSTCVFWEASHHVNCTVLLDRPGVGGSAPATEAGLFCFVGPFFPASSTRNCRKLMEHTPEHQCKDIILFCFHTFAISHCFFYHIWKLLRITRSRPLSGLHWLQLIWGWDETTNSKWLFPHYICVLKFFGENRHNLKIKISKD